MRAAAALETIEEGVSGLFFHEQTVDSLVQAMRVFESEESNFTQAKCVASSRKFSRAQFLGQFNALLSSVAPGYSSSAPPAVIGFERTTPLLRKVAESLPPP